MYDPNEIRNFLRITHSSFMPFGVNKLRDFSYFLRLPCWMLHYRKIIFQTLCLKIDLSSVSGPSPPLLPKAVPDSESCLISICIFCSYSQVCLVIRRSTSTADLCNAASSSLINLSCSSCLTWCKKTLFLHLHFKYNFLLHSQMHSWSLRKILVESTVLWNKIFWRNNKLFMKCTFIPLKNSYCISNFNQAKYLLA